MKELQRTFQNFRAILTGEKRASEYGKYRFICFVLAAVHVILLIRFITVNYPILIGYNVFAVLFYTFLAVNLSAKEKYSLIYYLCYGEITFFSSFATILAGWDWGFMVYLIALTPVAFYLTYSSPKFGRGIGKPLALVFVSMSVFVVTRILTIHIPPIYTNHRFDSDLSLSYSFNSILAFFSLMLFSILFTIEIRLNENQLKEQYALLESISSRDPLTGLLNRRSMGKYLTDAVDQSKSNGLVFSVILGDIDDFKKVNDTYGHNIGDLVLIEVSRTIKERITPGCEVCRWGGEEILIFVPENEIVTKGLAEKIRLSIADITVPTGEGDIHVTMTFGVAEYSPGLPLNKLVSVADTRLYYGKQHGKNQVVDKIEE